MKPLIRSYRTVELQDFKKKKKNDMCYFISERQLYIGYIRVVALVVLRKLGLKKIPKAVQTSETSGSGCSKHR